MKTTSVKYETFRTLFQGFETEFDKVTCSNSVFVWKGGIPRNLALMLNGKKYHNIQKDLDVYTTDVERWKDLDDDVFPIYRKETGNIDWAKFFIDDITLNNVIVVQKGKRILVVYGDDYDCNSIKPLGYNWDDIYQSCKENWRALIFGYRYKELGIHLNKKAIRKEFQYGNVYEIGWLHKQGKKKIGSRWLDFEIYVNNELGVEFFEQQTKYEKEAAWWFPNEGY
jgi:hypothetical protein